MRPAQHPGNYNQANGKKYPQIPHPRVDTILRLSAVEPISEAALVLLPDIHQPCDFRNRVSDRADQQQASVPKDSPSKRNLQNEKLLFKKLLLG